MDTLNWSKVTVKTFILIQKISNKCCSSANHIRVISKRSRDTEDWSNAENTGINYILTCKWHHVTVFTVF